MKSFHANKIKVEAARAFAIFVMQIGASTEIVSDFSSLSFFFTFGSLSARQMEITQIKAFRGLCKTLGGQIKPL